MQNLLSREELQAFTAKVADAFNAGKIRAPVHLSGGNELELREIFLDVKEKDWVCTYWRSHYHCLLKGVPADTLMVDILAGKSITLCYPDYRIVSSAIVGGAIPIALGIAWSIKRRQGEEVVHCFLGDMTAAAGIFLECQNYAINFQLPIRFYIEDNGKSVCTPTEEACGKRPVLSTSTPGYHKGTFGLAWRRKYELPWPHSGAGKRVNF